MVECRIKGDGPPDLIDICSETELSASLAYIGGRKVNQFPPILSTTGALFRMNLRP
jgi:hypothetical protein